MSEDRIEEIRDALNAAIENPDEAATYARHALDLLDAAAGDDPDREIDRPAPEILLEFSDAFEYERVERYEGRLLVRVRACHTGRVSVHVWPGAAGWVEFVSWVAPYPTGLRGLLCPEDYLDRERVRVVTAALLEASGL